MPAWSQSIDFGRLLRGALPPFHFLMLHLDAEQPRGDRFSAPEMIRDCICGEMWLMMKDAYQARNQ